MSRVTSGDGQGRHLAGGVVCLGFLAALLAAAPATADDEVASGGAVTILDGSGFWRALHSWAAPWVTVDKELKEHKPDGRRVCKCTGSGFRYMTRYPAREWTQVEFDDSTWPRRHFFAKYVNGESDQRAGGGSGSSKLRQLSLRGKFTVTDPAGNGTVADHGLSRRGGRLPERA